MTPKELYDWTVEMDAENYDIQIEWMGEYGFAVIFPKKINYHSADHKNN